MSSQRARSAAEADAEPILSVRNLRTVFDAKQGMVRAVDGVSFDVQPGETIGLVGESGSGKSVTARSIMGLVESPGEIREGSSIRFQGRELTDLSEDEYREVRGNGIGIVFQDPQTSLNPVFTVGNQIEEALRVNRGLRGEAARKTAIELLEAVSIPDAARRLSEYPHEFSGGMRQRAVIAMMLACDPELLICDEPTTALDVTIQAQIIELLENLQEERDLSILFITHDMGVIAQIADRVNVMYAGEIIEKASVEELFKAPKHPYTQGLLEAIPGQYADEDRLRTIEGEVATPTEAATYCRFAPRCPKAFDECDAVHPALVEPMAGDRDLDPDELIDDPDATVAEVGDVTVETDELDADEVSHEVACLLYPEDRSEAEAVAHHRSIRENEDGTGGRDAGDERGGRDAGDGPVDRAVGEADAVDEDGETQ